MAFWVYLLRCADDSYYTGHTDNLQWRLGQHQSGELPGHTHERRPVHLVFSQDFQTREEALSMELRLKDWSRARKKALINNDGAAVNRLGRDKHLHQRKLSA